MNKNPKSKSFLRNMDLEDILNLIHEDLVRIAEALESSPAGGDNSEETGEPGGPVDGESGDPEEPVDSELGPVESEPSVPSDGD